MILFFLLISASTNQSILSSDNSTNATSSTASGNFGNMTNIFGSIVDKFWNMTGSFGNTTDPLVNGTKVHSLLDNKSKRIVEDSSDYEVENSSKSTTPTAAVTELKMTNMPEKVANDIANSLLLGGSFGKRITENHPRSRRMAEDSTDDFPTENPDDDQ